MSKYNNLQSIPVDSIPKEEIKDAITEWAEGDESLEQLLWTCYNNGIKTDSCHAGAKSYITFSHDNDAKILSKIIKFMDKTNDMQVLICMAGNPFSGPTWHLPTICLSFETNYKDETDKYFDELNDILKTNYDNEKVHPLVAFMDYFSKEKNDFLFRMRHKKDNTFDFIIEISRINDKRLNYYNSVFTNAGLKETIFPKINRRHFWSIQSDNVDELLLKMEKALKYIVENSFDYSLPNKEEEILNFIEKSLYMKNKLSDEEFSKWLQHEKETKYK